ncbi:MAG: hypothetical protein IKY55_00690 [Phascolarctobacterium sp.]|nr:hypothetical protein [Phascolarctobacterium sp.]
MREECEVRKELDFVIKNFINFILSAIVCALVLGCILLDVNTFKGVPEKGFVEYAQEVLIFMSGSIFLFLAWKKQDAGMWLVGGFLSCMFIRELDAVFDKVFHGAWAYIAIPFACFCVCKAWREGKEKIITSLANFMRTQSYTRLSSGLLTVLVFSRLIGYGPIWKAVMGQKVWMGKTIAEEGTELFGYSIIFLAAIEYAYYLLNKKEIE